MHLNWSLKEIYESIDSQKFKNDFDKYKEEINKINKWADKNLNGDENITKKLEEYIILKNRIGYYSMLDIYLNLSQSVDTSNEKYSKLIDILNEYESEIIKSEIKFIRFLKYINNLDEIINNSNVLKQHSYFLKSMKEKSKYMLSSEEEYIITKMKNTGSAMWKKMWEQLTSNLMVSININNKEEVLPLSVIRNYAYSDDACIRKKAYDSELKSYEKIDTVCSYALNNIKGEVINVSKLKGYSSVLEMTLIDSRLDKKIIDIMFNEIDKNIDILQKYFIKKAEILGHKNGLPFYDLFAPVCKNNLKFTYEQAQKFIIENFYNFSSKLGKFAENAFKNNWIDVSPKAGKMGGAFCESVHPIKQSRILTNFSGSFNDVVTIAHELGHAYHDSCLYDETEINSFYPMPIAETASTFCETIVINAALKNATNENYLTIIENDISGIAQVIVDIYSRYLFEDEVFKHREKGSLSVNELNEIMINSQKKTYGRGLDENYYHKYMWVCKPHYYDADFNYYNFPYAFGMLFSKGLYSLYTENKEEFIPLYDKMLSSTGKNNIADTAKIAGIDLYSREFWKSSFKIISKEIENFINYKIN